MKDLTGDPVYDWIKAQEKERTIIGAEIIEPSRFSPNGARKIIRFLMETPNKQKKMVAINYNKVLKRIEGA